MKRISDGPGLKRAMYLLIIGGTIFSMSACAKTDLKTSTLYIAEETNSDCPGGYYIEENGNKVCTDQNSGGGFGEQQYQEPQEYQQNNQQNYQQNGQMDQQNYQQNGQMGPQNDCFSAENKECHDKAIKADLRDIERMKREITNLLKTSKTDAGTLNGYLTKLDELKTQLVNATSQEEVEAARQGIQEGIGQNLQSYRCADEQVRIEKDVKMQKQNFNNSTKHLKEVKVSNEWDSKIDEQLDRMTKLEGLQNKLLEAVKSCSQDDMDSVRWEMDDLRMSMDDFWSSFDSVQNTIWATQMFNQVEKDMASFMKDGYGKLSEDMQKKADEIFAIAKTLIENGRQAIKANDMDSVKDYQQKLQELGQKANSIFGRPEAKFEDMGYTKEFDKKFDTASQEMSYEQKVQMVQEILSANPEIMEKVLKGDPMLAEKTMKIFGRVPENMKSDYLSGKADLSDVYNEVLAKNKGLASYKDDILGYNYFGNASNEMIAALKEVRDGTMTLDEFVTKLNAWKDTSKEAKYTAGVTSFQDYDDSAWYYDSVEGMKDFLKGKQTKDGVAFAGGDNITFAETLKIALERFNKGQSDGTPAYAKAKNHWAKGYYATAEQMGVSLLDPDHLITRGEMARLIVEITLGKPTSHSSSNFSDLNTSNPYFDYLETLYDYKIMTGDGNESGMATVRPNSTINRAETAKVIGTAFDTLQLETMDVDDLNDWMEEPSQTTETTINQETSGGGGGWGQGMNTETR